MLLAARAVLVGGGLQSATGFGFALIGAPVLFATIGPQPAIGAMIVLGLVLNSLTLGSERRTPRPLREDAAWLLIASMPGLAVGAYVLREVPDRALQAL